MDSSLRGGDDVSEETQVPYFHDDTVTLYLGDALDVARQMPSESVDCIVTSPP